MSSPSDQPNEKLPVRERLLRAAETLFYEQGTYTVGVDRVLEQAGVARASLYSAFGSKDALICAYLERRQAFRRERTEACMASLDTPRDRILGLFEAMERNLALPGANGCPFMRAGADGGTDASVMAVIRQSRRWMLDLLTGLARDAGAASPEVLGQQLAMLYDGVLSSAYLDESFRPAASAARVAARMLLDASLREA